MGVLSCVVVLLGGVTGEDSSSGALHSPQTRRPVSPDATPVTLVEDGRAEAVIVIPDMSPRRRADKAAKDLQEHIEKASGGRLPTAKSSEYEGDLVIFVGESEASRKAGFDAQGLGVEWFRIATGPQSLAIMGYDGETFETVGPNGQKVMEKTDSQGTLLGYFLFVGEDRLREDFGDTSATRWETKINPWKEREKEAASSAAPEPPTEDGSESP